jgi:predicted O-methyltransferase YrrM/CDP-glycerol glycerophosphotransferase (TagB/SpsB family)
MSLMQPTPIGPASQRSLATTESLSQAALSVPAEDSGQRSDRRPAVLFAMAHVGFVRNFKDVIKRLADQNVAVHVLPGKHHASLSADRYSFPDVDAEVEFLDPLYDSKLNAWSERIHILQDALHYSRPEFDGAQGLRNRFWELQKDFLPQWTLDLCRTATVKISAKSRRFLQRLLGSLDSRIPARREFFELLDRVQPDLVVATPYVNFASREVELVKAARARGIRCLLAVASWDNLTNKGVMKVRPDMVAVWNQAMAREAVNLHGVSAKRVAITGAPVFDWWFDSKPSTSRDEFLAARGLDPQKPLIVYLCSSNSVAGRHEEHLVQQWLDTLRASDDENLRTANILIRPHPMATTCWKELFPDAGSSASFASGIVWPVHPDYVTSDEAKQELFDTLHHASAVVGLNTSTMIEAAILNKPVLTFTEHSRRKMQVESIHFHHLVRGRFLQVASDVSEHIQQLAATLHDTDQAAENARGFVRDFVRPISLERPASDELAELIVNLAEAESTSAPVAQSQVRTPQNGRAGNVIAASFYKKVSAVPDARIYPVQLEQLFPGISEVPVEIGAVDPDTGHVNHVDMLYVVAIARKLQSQRIFEFGTYLGRTTYHLACGNPDSKIFTLDLDPSTELKLGPAIRAVHKRGLQGCFFRDAPCASRITQLHGDSHTFDYGPFKGQMDFVFVDAAHEYDPVKNDTARAFELLAPGGVIVWHDYADKSPGVMQLLAEVSQETPLFHIEKTSLAVYVDGIDASKFEPVLAPYARKVLKPKPV